MTFAFHFEDEEEEEATIEQSGEGDYLLHPIEDLVKYLPEVLSYSLVAGQPRRELWDIKHQLMSDDESALQFVAADDVIHGEYEGGFKTWECSIDLAEYLETYTLPESFCELGCGSALPTLVLFDRALKEDRNIRIALQDYNIEVLRYVTLPNLYLTWARHQGLCSDGEVEVDATAFLSDLTRRQIDISFLSGPWSGSMVDHIKVDLTLASETIYNPAYISAFTRLLSATSLIAAKCMYFGVGGSLDTFLAQAKNFSHEEVFSTKVGVKRVIYVLRRLP